MTDRLQGEMPLPAQKARSGAMLLAVGGLTAAIGAASCCALPLLLGAVGVGGVWLGTVGLAAGPYRGFLLLTAIILLGASGIIFRHQRAGASGAACASSPPGMLTTITLSLGVILVALSLAFA